LGVRREDAARTHTERHLAYVRLICQVEEGREIIAALQRETERTTRGRQAARERWAVHP
jgi:hypothetical protein